MGFMLGMGGWQENECIETMCCLHAWADCTKAIGGAPAASDSDSSQTDRLQAGSERSGSARHVFPRRHLRPGYAELSLLHLDGRLEQIGLGGWEKRGLHVPAVHK